ncbi:hypothetical protein BV22DRAFT_1032749 [Leucogyrophana mollusca]|uniref:Uncharacterized protein n=1 Tax=Leucogyrophana mollusca TaxID=85980 RepID=A0ACB8BN96_9AGAM|nr:hypothetical protein BV22DRAFT_1032749 [Leucogyrophana mollusca]
MLSRSALSAFVVATLSLAANAQYEQYPCPSIPLCCETVVDGPSITPSVTNLTTALNISSADVVFPVGISCVPIMDPPSTAILVCSSPEQQVCCETNNWDGEIAFGCSSDPPVSEGK